LSSKGKLLKGVLERIPKESLEIVESELKEVMKGYAGIYALYKGKKLYYVGLTKYLHGRLFHHSTRDRHAGKWDNFSVFMIRRVEYLKDLETLVLRISKPRANKMKGNLPEEGKLKKKLRQKLWIYGNKVKKIRKVLW
jgi:hypothetical protein